MLSPEQNKIFDEYDKMFITEGWKMFLSDIKKNQEAIFPALMGSPATIEDLHFLKGRNDVYNSILGLQDLMKYAKQEMQGE